MKNKYCGTKINNFATKNKHLVTKIKNVATKQSKAVKKFYLKKCNKSVIGGYEKNYSILLRTKWQ